MPQIGWFEIFVIVIIAILVIGPKEFPVVLRKVGSWVGSLKRYFSEMQRNMNEITNIDDQETKKANDKENDEERK